MKKFLLTASAAVVAIAASAGYAAARDQIQIAGSSTVLPYAKIVAETFGETFTNFKTPVVESGGSGAGIKEFCKGVGENTTDIANSSRKMKEDYLMDMLKKSKADAAILTAAKFCEPGLDEQLAWSKHLDVENIPYLVLEFEEKMTSFEQMAMQVETFAESLLFALA